MDIEDRVIKEEWCQLLGGRHIDYYTKLTDEALEREYVKLTEHASNQMR